MKRIFCDLCNKEFSYQDQSVSHTNQATHTFLKPRTGNEPALEFTVTLNVVAKTLIKAPRPLTPDMRFRNWEDNAKPIIKRQHADLCGSCRGELIKRIVHGTDDLEVTGLKWDTAGPEHELREPDVRDL